MPITAITIETFIRRREQYLSRYKQYSGNLPAFDSVGSPFEFSGKRA